MSTRYDFLVDTSPMGRSISTIAEDVRATGLTVISSAEAIGVAEAAAAEKISANISYGFFNLVVSQLNQKMARLRSSLQARDAQLLQERKTAEALRMQFFRDFQMIKRRYHRLFNGLNKSLKLRVFELDKPITSVLVNGYQANVKQRNQNLAFPALLTSEGQQAGQGMEIGRAKQQALRLMEGIRSYLMKTFEVQAHIEAMLLEPTDASENKEMRLPALVMEYDSNAVGILGRQYQFAGNEGDSARLYQDVVQAVSNQETPEERWVAVKETDLEKVRSRFQKLLDSSELGDRERAEVQRLLTAQVTWSEVRGTYP